MALSRGDVVLIAVPGDLGKPRPAIVVQADELGQRRTFVVCPLSSEVGAVSSLRPVVAPGAANGLRARSQIMTELVTAVRSERIRRTIGHVDDETMAELDRALLLVLGLAR